MNLIKDKGGQFEVVGLVVSPHFQKCRGYTEALHKSLPKLYPKPVIRPLLNLGWEEYIVNAKRIFGKRMWELEKSVVVYLDGEYLGDDDDLMKYICERYQLYLSDDFHLKGKEQLAEILAQTVKKGRHFVYITIAINEKVLGSMLFELYSDLVPLTCERFLEKVRNKKNGFIGTPIHRIVRGCWIQCGGWGLVHHRMPCENYIVPHDKKGVLSMCHGGKHQENSYQFNITLAAAPWMDYKYVAFGQLVQGNELLNIIEQLPTYYESPINKIQIVFCGEFDLYEEDDAKALKEVEAYLEDIDPITGLHKDILDSRDKDSCMDIRRYRRGLYCPLSDLQSHLPFLHLPDYLLSYLQLSVAGPRQMIIAGEDEGDVHLQPLQPQPRFESLARSNVDRSKAFLIEKSGDSMTHYPATDPFDITPFFGEDVDYYTVPEVMMNHETEVSSFDGSPEKKVEQDKLSTVYEEPEPEG